jgi:hypothetical protein
VVDVKPSATPRAGAGLGEAASPLVTASRAPAVGSATTMPGILVVLPSSAGAASGDVEGVPLASGVDELVPLSAATAACGAAAGSITGTTACVVVFVAVSSELPVDAVLSVGPTAGGILLPAAGSVVGGGGVDSLLEGGGISDPAAGVVGLSLVVFDS